MNKYRNKKRLGGINRMLLEIAGGNLSYRIERSGQNDALEALITLVNMMTEELGESMRHQTYVNQSEYSKHIAQMTFVLDARFHVRNFNPITPGILLFDEREIRGKPLSALLTKESKPVWQDFQSRISGGRTCNYTLELSFRAREHFIVPTTCSISTLINAHNQVSIMVTAIETVTQGEVVKGELQKLTVHNGKTYHQSSPENALRIMLSDLDLKKIGKVREYIINKLNEPNFSVKELAHTLGTNEFKLKYGFKQLYGTTVFRYLQEERLRKAELLVQHSRLPLKKVAEMTGFKTAPHFSRAFKDRYGYTPSEFRKQFREKTKKT